MSNSQRQSCSNNSTPIRFKRSVRFIPIFAFALAFLFTAPAHAAQPTVWNLWPGAPPLKHSITEPEYDRTTSDGRLAAGRRVTRLTNVTTPTLAIYKPAASLDTGAASHDSSPKGVAAGVIAGGIFGISCQGVGGIARFITGNNPGFTSSLGSVDVVEYLAMNVADNRFCWFAGRSQLA